MYRTQITYLKQKNKNHEIIPSTLFPQQKTKKTKEVFCFTSSVSSTRSFYFASGGRGKNRESQSETLASYIKTTYLNKELWNFSEEAHFGDSQLCQHVWAWRNISVHFQITHLASFLSPYQFDILKTGGNDIFAFQKIAITTRETRWKENWLILSVALQLQYVRSIKRNNIKTVDYGLWTVDNRFRSTPPRKKLFCAYSSFSKVFKVCYR